MECFDQEGKVRDDEGVIARTRGAHPAGRLCAPEIRAPAAMAATRVTDTVHRVGTFLRPRPKRTALHQHGESLLAARSDKNSRLRA
jgi:hypothetical protein